MSIPGPRSFLGGGMSKHSGRWVPEGEYSPTNTTPTWDLLGVGTHPPLLTPSGSHQNMYGWQTIGLLVFFILFIKSGDFLLPAPLPHSQLMAYFRFRRLFHPKPLAVRIALYKLCICHNVAKMFRLRDFYRPQTKSGSR